jgi:hypothetical protein
MHERFPNLEVFRLLPNEEAQVVGDEIHALRVNRVFDEQELRPFHDVRIRLFQVRFRLSTAGTEPVGEHVHLDLRIQLPERHRERIRVCAGGVPQPQEGHIRAGDHHRRQKGSFRQVPRHRSPPRLELLPHASEITGRECNPRHTHTECHGNAHRAPSFDDGMLHIEKRKLRARRAGEHHREKAPEHGTIAEMEQQKAQGEEPDPQDGELHPENRPLVGRLARFGAQADGEEDGEHEGRRKARPHHRRPYPDGTEPDRPGFTGWR